MAKIKDQVAGMEAVVNGVMESVNKMNSTFENKLNEMARENSKKKDKNNDDIANVNPGKLKNRPSPRGQDTNDRTEVSAREAKEAERMKKRRQQIDGRQNRQQ